RLRGRRRLRGGSCCEPARQRQAAKERQPAHAHQFAPGNAVAEPLPVPQDPQHGQLLVWRCGISYHAGAYQPTCDFPTPCPQFPAPNPSPMPLPANVRIVLVQPESPGNIGAAARAMQTMGLSDLVLVAPACDPGADESYMLAHSAANIVRRARIV